MAPEWDCIHWHQLEDAQAAPLVPTAQQGWFGFPLASEQLLSLSTTSSTWRDTGKELLQQIFSYQRDDGTQRKLPAVCCRVPSRYTAAPEGDQQISPITDRKRGGKAVLWLRTPSTEPSPHPCFLLVAVSAVGAPDGAGAPQREGNFAKLISVQGFSLSQARIFLTPKGTVKVRVYLISTTHPARRADAWTALPAAGADSQTILCREAPGFLCPREQSRQGRSEACQGEFSR